MKFIWFLAFRYLKPRGTFFSIITLLSIVGVMLGVGVLIVVIGVMSGFERNIKQNILGLQAEIVLSEYSQVLDESGKALPRPPDWVDWRKCRELAKAMPHVKSVSPYINLITLIEPDVQGNAEPQVANFLGLDPDDPANEAQLTKLKKMMIAESEGGGVFDLGSGAKGDNIVINRKLANRLGVGVGDKVNTFSPEMMKEVRGAWKRWEATKDKPEERKTAEDEMSKLLVPTEFYVAGMFDSPAHSDFVIFSLDSAQTLSGKAGSDFITGLAVATEDPLAADSTFRAMLDNPQMPPNWGGHTWIDANRNFFNAIQNERSMMFLVLMIIVVVAAFSTMISMIIFAVQKRREIGMVRALGATTPQILGIFTVQGMIIGLVGVIAGVIAGKTVLHFRNPIRTWLSQKLHIDIFPADIYGLSELPAYLRPEDLNMICIVSWSLCTVAALLPAFMSTQGNPAKELRGGSQ